MSSVLHYLQSLEEISRAHPSEEFIGWHEKAWFLQILNPITEWYVGAISTLGEEVIQGIKRAGGDYYGIKLKLLGEQYGKEVLRPSQMLEKASAAQFVSESTVHEQMVRGAIPDFRDLLKILRGTFPGKWCGSECPVELKSELEANSSKVIYRTELRTWQDTHPFHNCRTPKAEALRDTFFHRLSEIKGIASSLKLDSFHLSYDLNSYDELRLRGQEPGNAYQFGFVYRSGQHIDGYDYGMTYANTEDRESFATIAGGIIKYDLSGGREILPLGAIPLAMLEGMRRALSEKEQVSREPLTESASSA